MLVLATAATAGAARADAVSDWNGTAVMAVQTLGPSTPTQSRALAIVHLAMFDALNTIDRRYASYAEPLQAPAEASPDAAAATAAHEVLVRLIPLQKAALDGALERSLRLRKSPPPRSSTLPTPAGYCD